MTCIFFRMFYALKVHKLKCSVTYSRITCIDSFGYFGKGQIQIICDTFEALLCPLAPAILSLI
jgi:hypothetical protein